MIMCNNNEYIKRMTTYIGAVINEDVVAKPVCKSVLDLLPMSIVGNFKLYHGQILGKNLIFVYIEDADMITPVMTKKQLDIIQKRTGIITVLVPKHLHSYNVGRLIAQKVNFVIPDKQMFIPSLLLDLKNDKVIDGDIKDSITPMTQCLLLYHLEVESISGKTSYELADKLSVSYASINRALRWLVTKDLIKQEGVKTKTVQIELSGRELWDKALPMLVSPIEQIYYTDAPLEGQ